LASDPSRDAAVAAFTSRIASVDPQTAVQWAATIAEPGARSSEIQAAIESWFEVDPAKASAWLASSGLPDEIKVRFLPPQG
jgi:ferric-dicitrate binding protein FerR (iron transport regulator)